MPVREESIEFAIASRRLYAARRKVKRLSFSLEDILSGSEPVIPDLQGCEGLQVRSLPVALHATFLRKLPGLVTGASRRYYRRYIPMEAGFDAYCSHFQAKTRQTLRRKTRRFANASGGQLDVREYRSPAEIEEFFRIALPLSDRTYQHQLLHKGLRGDDGSRAAASALAEADRLRCFILFCSGQPAAYLYLPIAGSTLIYAHLGYDPDLAALSPGTVLQLAALERLYGEDRFSYFDFTEGDGAHKQLFGTHGVECETFIMLKPNLANQTIQIAHRAFAGTIAFGRGLLK